MSGFKSDVTVPVVENEESLVRTDSYENFNKVQETVDGMKLLSSLNRLINGVKSRLLVEQTLQIC